MNEAVCFARAAARPALLESLTSAGLALAPLDGNTVRDGPDLLTALGRALAFPPYYGRNWDAAEECLRDLRQHYPRGCALVVDGAGSLWQRLPEEMGLLTSLWLAAAESLAREGVPLHLVFLLEDEACAADIGRR